MANYTTINLTQETKGRLDALKVIPDESYESLIKRLIELVSRKEGDSNGKRDGSDSAPNA